MFLRHNLRKGLRLGDVLLMAANAQLGGIQFLRLDSRGIVGMRGERAVTRFTGNGFVHAFALHVEDLGVATLADLVSCIRNRTRRYFGDRVAPIMSVLPKTLWHQQTARDQKQHEPDQEDGCQAEEVFRIFEFLHSADNGTCSVDIRTRSQPAVFWVT